MADETKKATVAAEKPATVLKSDYDALIKEYQRLSAAFNRAMNIIGNTYAEQLAKSIFEDIDKAANQQK